MSEPRAHQTATLLGDGDVLVAGGYQLHELTGRVELASAELFHPGSRSWTQAAPMKIGRDGASAALLPDGRVLVVGGWEGRCCEEPESAEIYDPASNAWSEAAVPAELRGVETLTALSGGHVLLVGTFGPHSYGALSVGARMYDPASGEWTTVAAPHAERQRDAAAILLANGDVLLLGGAKLEATPPPVRTLTTPFATVEEYDPITNTWTDRAPLFIPRANHTASLLANGQVFVTGGWSGPSGASLGPFETVSSSEIYEPATNTWRPTAPMRFARYEHTATVLGSGNVLVAGGPACSPETGIACLGFGEPPASGDCCAASSAEIYEPAADRWTSTEPAVSGVEHTATLLEDGEVLLAGGGQLQGAFREFSSAYLYGPLPGALPPSQPPRQVALTPLPVISELSETHHRWRERYDPRAPRVPVGTTFSFHLNTSASVQLSITRINRRSGRCAHLQRKHPTCKYKRPADSAILGLRGKPGTHRVKFRGLWQHHWLPAGTYTLSATATNQTGSATPRRISFVITPAPWRPARRHARGPSSR